jgi:hypothetical protein
MAKLVMKLDLDLLPTVAEELGAPDGATLVQELVQNALMGIQFLGVEHDTFKNQDTGVVLFAYRIEDAELNIQAEAA